MERNQLAKEIAAEYEAMGTKSATEHWHLKQIRPFAEFPALAAHVSFCTLMQKYWQQIQKRLDEGPEMYETKDDTENHNSEWGLM